MNVLLKKDIIIKAGTVLTKAPTKTERIGDGHVECTFGLSKNSFGTVTYSIEDPSELEEWFEVVEE